MGAPAPVSAGLWPICLQIGGRKNKGGPSDAPLWFPGDSASENISSVDLTARRPAAFGADRQPRPEPKPAQPTSPRLGRAALWPGDPSLASFRQNLRTDPADKLSTTCQQAIGRLSTSGQSTVNEAAISRPSARGQSVNKLSVPCPKSVNKLLARRRSIVGNYSTATSYLQRSDLPLPLVFHRSRRFPAVFPAVRRGIGTPSATTRRKP